MLSRRFFYKMNQKMATIALYIKKTRMKNSPPDNRPRLKKFFLLLYHYKIWDGGVIS